MGTDAIAIGGLAQKQEAPVLSPGKLKLLSRIERVRDAILGCTIHRWGFPVSSKDMEYKPKPYDSHQACTTCGRTRLFDFKAMRPGPMFVVRRKGTL